MEVENPVLNEIIRIIEKGNNWRKEEVGNKSFKDIQKIYKKDNSEKKNCNEILVKWEKSNYVKVDWYAYKTDIGKEGFSFSLKNKNLFYEMAEITPKAQRIAEYRAWIQAKIVDTQKGWILNYYESLLENLKQGKIPEFLEKDYEPVYQTENKELIRCMDELNLLDELTYKRIFSKKVFKNSKNLKKNMRKRSFQ